MTYSKNKYKILEKTEDDRYRIRFLCCGYESIVSNKRILEGPKCRRCSQKNKKSHDTFIKEVKELTNNEYEVLSKYENAKTKVKFKHKICGKEFLKTPNLFLSGQYCPDCGNKRTAESHRKSYEDIKSELKTLNGFEDYNLISIQEGLMLTLEHKKCKNIFNMRLSNFRHGQRCPKCGKIKAAKSHKLTQQEFENKIYDMYGDEFEIIGKYEGHRNKIKIKHKLCGKESNIIANNLLRWRGCPYCHRSKGEFRISRYLDKNNFVYEQEYTFEDLFVVNKLRFDFAVNFEKQLILIEYDGPIHFEENKFFTKNKNNRSYEEIRQYDTIKNKYADDNKIPLYRIKYTNFDNIENILDKIFKKHKEE